MSNISLNYAQIIDPLSFKSINLAKIYIGEYGTLPNPANAATWKQAYFVNSDGTRTAASQPIRTNAAGYAVDGSGNIKTIQVDGGYSLLVQDQYGATKFSQARSAANSGAVLEFDTITGFTGALDGSVCYFKGRDTVGDGGGGMFRYSASSTATADGGIVFAPAGGGRLFREGWTDSGFAGKVRPEWFGAVGDGAANDTAAIQAALNTGSAIDLGDASKTYLVTSTINYTGKVVITGTGAKIKTNIQWLKVTDGSGSVLHGFDVIPATTPYTIRRNTATWVNSASDVVQSLEGYIPTPQDTDIWASINPAYKTANESIKPMIYFTVSSAAGGKHVDISRIGGSQLCIVVEGYTDSSVHDCTYDSGQTTYGGILFFNGVNRAYNSALLGFTLPRGKNNTVLNNRTRYASLCGVCWFGNDDYFCVGNSVSLCGESGIKTYQYDGAAGPGETTACISTNGHIIDNKISGCFYDGIDAQVLYGVPYSYVYVGTQIKGNECKNQRHTGITALGSSFIVSGNTCNENGTYGLSVIGQNNTVAINHARRNSTTGTSLVAQPFDIQVQGDDCVSFGNNISNPSAPATWSYLHTGLWGSAPTSGREGLDFGNYCDEGAGRIFISPNIGSFLKQNNLYIQTSGWYQQTSGLVFVSGATYTVQNSDYQLDFYTAEICTVTLPSAADFKGRILKFRNTNTFAINSASANVQQIAGGAPSFAILANVAGKWCEMMSDGVTWKITSSN